MYMMLEHQKIRLAHNISYFAISSEKYEMLFGDIKKYDLYPICDWGETYIASPTNGIRIHHSDDDENIMLFNLIKGISKEDELNLIFHKNIDYDEFYNRIVINDLKAKELKEVLSILFGF